MNNSFDSKIKKLLSNTIVFSLGTICSKIILFLFVPLYTNVLSTGEYGKAELIATIVELSVPIISLNIGDSVLRFGLSSNVSKDSVIDNAFFLLLGGGLFFICLTPLLSYLDFFQGYVPFIAILSILSAFRTSFQYYAKVTDKVRLIAFDNLVYSISLAFFNIFFLLVLKLGLDGYLYSQIIAVLFSVIFLFIRNEIYRALREKAFDVNLLKKMLAYSIPLILNSLSWWIIHSTDKLMLQIMLSEESVGIYGVASKIPSLVNTVTYFFSQAWIISAITEYEETKDVSFYSKVFRFFNFVICAGVSFLLLILRPFMAVYVGSDFSESWMYVPLLLIAAVFRNYSDFFGAFFSSAKKNKTVAFTTFCGAAINIVFNYLLIPRYGIWGATISTAFSYFVVAIYRVFASKRFMKIDMKLFETLFSISMIFLQAICLMFDCYSLPVSILTFVSIFIINNHSIKIVFGLFKKDK